MPSDGSVPAGRPAQCGGRRRASRPLRPAGRTCPGPARPTTGVESSHVLRVRPDLAPAHPGAHLGVLGPVEGAAAPTADVAQVRASSGRTGREVAQADHDAATASATSASSTVAGMLSDHYDPRVKKVRLSDGIYGATRWRRSPSPPTRSATCSSTPRATRRCDPLGHRAGGEPGSMLAFPLFFIGMIFDSGMSATADGPGHPALRAAPCCSTSSRCRSSSTPRKRALRAAHRDAARSTPHEVAGAKKVLDAAALTYVAAAAMAALQLLRLVLLRNSRD